MTANSSITAPARDMPGDGVLDAIRSRRSLGRMRPDCPPRAAIEQILDAATWAPNHRLTEPWRFVVFAGDARLALGDAMARSHATHASTPPTPGDLERTRAKPLRAPVVIAVAVEPATGPKVVEIEEVAAGAAAVQNMLLAAYSLGLAGVWRTGDAAYDAEVKQFLGLTPAAHVLGFVYVGYPDMPSPVARRRPPAEVTTWRGWESGE